MISFADALSAHGEVGRVVHVTPSLVLVEGLPRVNQDELVVFESGDTGYVIGLRADQVEVVLFSNATLRPGLQVARTNTYFAVGVSADMYGLMIDPTGKVLAGTPTATATLEQRLVDLSPPPLMQRDLVRTPFETGVSIVDLVVPLGVGQRELVIGDRKVGKTAFLRQCVLSHAIKGGVSIYAAIGKRASELLQHQKFFVDRGVNNQVITVATSSRDTPGLIFQTPYVAMSMAEYFRDKGQDVLVVLDDLTMHAKYYREIMLAAGRFPGRSAYPGDVFYIHAKLMERAGNFTTGSITCLPVAETTLGDISGYIQTNLMSMTDGHIFFDTELYNQGRRPAIDTFMSVTRVGHQAQEAVFKSLSQELGRFLAHYRATMELMHFGGELGDDAKRTLELGDKVKVVFGQTASTVLPKRIGAVMIAGLFGGLWDSVAMGTFRDTFVSVATKYATDQTYRAQIDQYFTQVQTFEELINNTKSNSQLLLG